MTSQLVEDRATGAESAWFPSSWSNSCSLVRKSVLASVGVERRMANFEVVCSGPSSSIYNSPQHCHSVSGNFTGTGHVTVTS